ASSRRSNSLLRWPGAAPAKRAVWFPPRRCPQPLSRIAGGGGPRRKPRTGCGFFCFWHPHPPSRCALRHPFPRCGRGACDTMPSSTDKLPPLREVIARHGLAAKKSLGQNFILDLNLTRRIARSASPLNGVTVIEVGPGPGGLTRALLDEGSMRV